MRVENLEQTLVYEDLGEKKIISPTLPGNLSVAGCSQLILKQYFTYFSLGVF